MNRSRFQQQLKSPAKQRGVATLAIGMIILFLITLVTLYSFKAGQREQQISGNEYRYQLAFEAAQAGLEYGQMYLNEGKRNRAFDNWNWQSCADNPPTEWNASLASLCPAGTDASDQNDWIWFKIPDDPATDDDTVQPTDTSLRYRVFFVTPDTEEPATNDPDSLEDLQVTIVSEGASDLSAGETAFNQAQTGYTFNRVVVHSEPLLPGIPDVPLIVYSNAPPSGTADIVTNPNGAGRGIPVTVWAGEDFNFTGPAATCYPHEFYENYVSSPPYFYDPSQAGGIGNTFRFDAISSDPKEGIVLCHGCRCPTDESGLTTAANGENMDVLDDDPNFPDDLFEYIFGVPVTDYLDIKNDANTQIISGCGESELNENSSGLVWVTGNCTINANETIGSPLAPVLLVIEGTIHINGDTTVYGVVFAFSEDPANNTTEVKTNGSPEFFGAMVIDRNIEVFNGSYRLIYHEKILTNLSNSLQKLSRVPGTWADYL